MVRDEAALQKYTRVYRETLAISTAALYKLYYRQ